MPAHRILYRNESLYCAHPHTIRAGSRLLCVFNLAPRRPYTMHPPEDPFYRNALMHSDDEGETWSVPEVVPDFQMSGTECAGLTALSNGDVLLNQWQFRWLPLGLARTEPDQAQVTYPERFLDGWMKSPEHDVAAWRSVPAESLAPWARAGGRTLAHLSQDGGVSFRSTAQIDTGGFSGGYGMRGGVELPDGTILLPLNDVPHWEQIFGVTSRDGGRTWSAPALIASEPGHAFEEPATALTPKGRLVMVLRDNSGARRMHQVESFDLGQTWTKPKALPVAGYPADLLVLKDGRLLMTYGWRFPGFGVRAVVSDDDGETWDIDHTIIIRDDLPNKNLGYPATVQRQDGSLLTVYYGEDMTGATCIWGTSWRL